MPKVWFRLRAWRLAALVAWLWLLPCAGQDLRSLSGQRWGTEEGLPQSSVHAIAQTADGYLWVATEGGLARFDGYGFTVFDPANEPALHSGDICCLAASRVGELWIGTADGLVRMEAGRFRRFGEGEGLPSAAVQSLRTRADGGLEAETAGGWARRDGRRFVAMAATAEVPVTGRNGAVWSHTARSVTVARYGTTHSWSVGTELPASRVASVYVDREGFGWIATSAGLWVANAETLALTRVDALGGESVLSLFEDAEGDHWVGTETAGLEVLRWQTFRGEPGLGGVAVTSAVQSRDGAMWVGTRDDGVRRLQGTAWGVPVAGARLTSPVVLCMAPAAQGGVWVGTPDGLNYIEGAGAAQGALMPSAAKAPFQSGQEMEGLKPVPFKAVPHQTRDESLDRALHGFRVRRITSADGLPDDYIRSLALAADGSLWVGTPHGLARIAGGVTAAGVNGRFAPTSETQIPYGNDKAKKHGSRQTQIPYGNDKTKEHGPRLRVVETLTTRDGLGGDLIGVLYAPGDSGGTALWASTSGGLSRIATDGAVKTYTTRDGLGSPIVTALAETGDGRLWAATADGGLSHLDGERFVSVPQTATGGARPNVIEAMVADGEGALWLRMDRGVRRVSAGWLRACVAGRCGAIEAGTTRYGLADGMPNEELVLSAPAMAWRAADGAVWFPTRGGVAVVDAAHLHESAAPPPVVVQGLAVDGSEEAVRGGEIAVPFGHSRITVEYAGLSFLAPTEVRYRFRLEGFDAGWTEAGARRSATYTNLPPGRYTFVVQAANRDGRWSALSSGQEASVRFRVVPPFYRRAWFVALTVGVFGLLLWGAYLLRLRVVRRRFDAVLAERNRMAREIHDTLTQDFVATTLQLDLLHQQLKAGQTERAIAQTLQTRQMVTEGLAEARRSIWELRANQAEDTLPTRLRRLVERDAFAAVRPRLEVGGVYRALEERSEREVLRIAQEALTNAARHAEATEIWVTLRYSREALTLQVRDDGRGFVVDEATMKADHYGLLGMRERAAGIGAALEIVSAAGEGSTVSLVMPLAAESR